VIGNLPAPYPDELAYSVQSRYREMLGVGSHNFELHCFGSRIGRNAPLCSMFPAILVLPGQQSRFDSERYAEWLHMQTHWPFFAHFQMASVSRLGVSYGLCKKLRSELLLRSSEAPTLGSKVAGWQLRHCTECAASDRAKHGEAYWRRTHNLPGVAVCAEHQCALRIAQETESSGKNKKYRTYVPLERCGTPRELLTGGSRTVFERAARIAALMLNENLCNQGGLVAAQFYTKVIAANQRRGETDEKTIGRLAMTVANASHVRELIESHLLNPRHFTEVAVAKTFRSSAKMVTDTSVHVWIAAVLGLESVWNEAFRSGDNPRRSPLTTDLDLCGGRFCRQVSPDWLVHLQSAAASCRATRKTQCARCGFTAEAFADGSERIRDHGREYWGIAEALFRDPNIPNGDITDLMQVRGATWFTKLAATHGIVPSWRLLGPRHLAQTRQPGFTGWKRSETKDAKLIRRSSASKSKRVSTK
jgi:ribosomal protein L37E